MKKSLLALACGVLGLMNDVASADSWTTDYAKALDSARVQGKQVLLDFTGSDWCGWCIKMKKETLDTHAFSEYADKNLILVEVDFPKSKPQDGALKSQNRELSQKFGAEGFPTFVLVDKDGRELTRQSGYLPGGPEAFIAKLQKAKR